MKKVVVIALYYQIRGINALRRGEWYLKGRTPERVAFEWIRQLKREEDVTGIEKIILDGIEDITEKVLQMQKAPLD